VLDKLRKQVAVEFEQISKLRVSKVPALFQASVLFSV